MVCCMLIILGLLVVMPEINGNAMASGAAKTSADTLTHRYWFPRLLFEPGVRVEGFGFVNPGDVGATLRFVGYGAEGQPLGDPVERQWPAGSQGAYQADGLLSLTSAAEGWVEVMADQPGLSGMFLSQQYTPGLGMDGASVILSGTMAGVFSRVAVGAEYETELLLANPNAEAVTLTLTLLGTGPDAELGTWELPGRGMVHLNLSDLTSVKSSSTEGAVWVEANGPVIGNALVRHDAGTLSSLNLQDVTGASHCLFAPHVVNLPDYDTTVQLVNVGAEETVVVARIFRADGTVGADEHTLTLSPGRWVRLTAADLELPADFEGWLRIDSDGAPLAGSVTFGQPDDRGYESTLPLSAEGLRDACFAQVANGPVGGIEYYTGLAVLNPHPQPVDISIGIFHPDGTPNGILVTRTLQPGEKYVRLVQFMEGVGSLTPQGSGSLTVTAVQPVHSFALFGNTSFEFLSAVPATIPTVFRAVQNLEADPRGRVIDVTFDRPVSLAFPDDNIRFEIDLVRPLGRDICFGVGDLDGDGIADLLGRSFDGTCLFFPGIDANPFRLGEAQFVRISDWEYGPYAEFGGGALWEGVAIADFDGDGVPDVVIGRTIYTQVIPGNPTWMQTAHTLEVDHIWDLFPSAGDLDGDGKPDLVMTATYLPPNAYLHRNQSTPGNFAFHRELLTDHYRPEVSYEGARGLAVADLNTDGLPDLISHHGLFFNEGTATAPVFDFDHPTAYAVVDGPWVDGVESDQAISIFMHDGDGDGRVDAYVSNYGTSVWQGSFYKNVGSPSSPAFQFQAPILCRSTPYDNSYRGYGEPSFSANPVRIANGDANRDGLPDIFVSNWGMSASETTVLWNRSTCGPDQRFAWMDIYTFFDDGYPSLNPYELFWIPNWLPDGALSWKDYTGDGLEDIIRTDGFMGEFDLYFHERTAEYPIRFGEEQRMTTVSGPDMFGIGLAELDLDGDGVNDFIFGSPDGELVCHRNLGGDDHLIFDDQVLATDLSGTPIDVGENSWPVAFDWDGDGDNDLLVGEQAGQIYILINHNGRFSPGGLLGAAGWNPLDLNQGVVGGPVLSPSLATVDLNGDQVMDILGGGDSPSVIWYFENVGDPPTPQFSEEPVVISRTIPGFVEAIDGCTCRVYFGFPVLPGETRLMFYANPNDSQPTVRPIAPAIGKSNRGKGID